MQIREQPLNSHLAKAFVNLMQLSEMKRKAQLSLQADPNLMSERNVFGSLE